MYYRLEVSPKPDAPDPRGEGVLAQGKLFLELPLKSVRTRDVYSLFVDCSRADAEGAVAAFANRVIEHGVVGETVPAHPFDWVVIVGFRPGVTDNVARSARAAIADILQRPLESDETVYASVEYFISGRRLTRKAVEKLAFELLANELIQTCTVMSRAEWETDHAPVNQPAVEEQSAPEVKTVDLDVSDDALMQISRQGVLALTLDEMKAIQQYFRTCSAERRQRGLPANPTDVELECLAQTWSEHCKHKIFNARIAYTDETGRTQIIDSCFKTFIKRSTDEIAATVDWLVSVFHDNAGVIRFNDDVNLVYKVETHNSPTALDPYGGAMTGIVGVNRDPLGTGLGAELLLNVWGYCFASPFTAQDDVPKGLFHPRRLRDQVHKGVIDGGNQSGIPYALGWEYFDERYLGKPLVYCGTVGKLPHDLGGQPAHEKSIEPGDYAVMIGGRIGKDGIHGATFSSEELHTESPTQAVQIGDPITQKILTDFLMEARDALLYRFITDNGAGGLSSSIGEMSEVSGGCDIELADAPLKYAGLQPWEILLSEAQERMSLAVPPERLDAFMDLARKRGVEATVLGTFTDSGRFEVKYKGELVASLDEQFLHDGLPQMTIPAKWEPPRHAEPDNVDAPDLSDTLVRMMGRLNICSNEYMARQYDHEVKGLSVIKPFVGANNNVVSDATVSMIDQLSREGVILTAGVAPRYSDVDTYHMMGSIIDMAVRRTVAVGGRLGHIAGLDNFCWPDPVAGPKNPDGEHKAAQLVRANQALYDYTTAYGVPCISGKDSMKNDSTVGGRKISIPPTVLFSTIARMADIRKAITLDAKRDGDLVYVMGTTRRELGGSEYYAMLGAVGNSVPRVDPKAALEIYEKVAASTDAELCHSLHTPAVGGLAVGFAKVAIGGHLGLDIDLEKVPKNGPQTAAETLFSESNSRFIATIGPHSREEFEAMLEGIPYACVGQVTLDPRLTLRLGAETILATLTVDELTASYTKTLDAI
ncbi:MAG: phosphoribosylformylglycinamidine synthase [Candidatus Pacebacteria bacterium]|nr:phosphoribosylformylglycinamidine synthase [Candidatus Paceibacterota bacterium]